MSHISYAIHDSQESAEAEISQLNSEFGLPHPDKGTSYSVAEQFGEVWRFKIKTQGIYKADHLVKNVQSFEIESPE